MSLDWNLSSGEEDNFENWAVEQEQQQQHLLAASFPDYISKPHNHNHDALVEENSDDEYSDRKSTAIDTTDGVVMSLPSDFDTLTHAQKTCENDDVDEESVDWEDVDDETGEARTISTISAKLPTKSVTLNLDNTGDMKENRGVKRKRRAPVRKVFHYHNLSLDLQSFLRMVQKTHLLSLSCHAVFASHYASNDEVLHVSHSLIPSAWTMSAAAMPTIYDMQHFSRWFTDLTTVSSGSSALSHPYSVSSRRSVNFKRLRGSHQTKRSAKKREEDSDFDFPKTPHRSSLIQYRLLEYSSHLSNLSNQQMPTTSTDCFNEYDMVLLFLAMARSMGWRARYVMVLEPIPQDLSVDHPLFVAMSNINIFLNSWKMENDNRKAAANPIDLVNSDDVDDDKKNDKLEEAAKRPNLLTNYRRKTNGADKNSSAQEDLSTSDSTAIRPLCWIEILCHAPRKSGDPKSPLRSLQWIHIDPVLGVVNRPTIVEQQLYAHHQFKDRIAMNKKRLPVPYALAVEHLTKWNEDVSGCDLVLRMTDVTRRYAFSMVETLRARGFETGEHSSKKIVVDTDESTGVWFAALLRQLSNHSKTETSRHQSTADTALSLKSIGYSDDNAILLDCEDYQPGQSSAIVTPEPPTVWDKGAVDQQEEHELEAAAKMEPLPTSKAAYKKHPKYALASCLNSSEVLVPDAKKRSCGIFKGEFVFLRSDVETALPEKKWLYRGRKVKDSELSHPVLKVKARKSSASKSFKALQSYGVGFSNDGSEESFAKQIQEASQPLSDGKVHLYGSWQTDPWSPAAVGSNDPIPANQYNNVELELLNPGLVHLDIQGITKTAKTLSIPYKPCMLGFEGHGGNRTPTIRGIVVHKHNEALLREAHAGVSHHLQQQQEDQRRKTILRRWKRLLLGVLTKERLQLEYGDES